MFDRVNAALTGTEYTPPDYETVIRTALRHAQMMTLWQGERFALIEMRKHFAWYLKGRRGAARVRTAIMTADSFGEVERLLYSLCGEQSGSAAGGDSV